MLYVGHRWRTEHVQGATRELSGGTVERYGISRMRSVTCFWPARAPYYRHGEVSVIASQGEVGAKCKRVPVSMYTMSASAGELTGRKDGRKAKKVWTATSTSTCLGAHVFFRAG